MVTVACVFNILIIFFSLLSVPDSHLPLFFLISSETLSGAQLSLSLISSIFLPLTSTEYHCHRSPSPPLGDCGFGCGIDDCVDFTIAISSISLPLSSSIGDCGCGSVVSVIVDLVFWLFYGVFWFFLLGLFLAFFFY